MPAGFYYFARTIFSLALLYVRAINLMLRLLAVLAVLILILALFGY